MSSAQNSSRRTTRAGSQTSRSYTCSSARNLTRQYDNSPRIRFEYKEDPDFRQTRKNLMSAKNFDGYDTQNLVSFYWKLRDHAYYCALRARYNDATEAERLLKYLKAELDLRGQPVAEPKQKSYVAEMIKEVSDEYEKKLHKFDHETKQRIQKIDEKHKEEQENFNKSWKSDKLRPFMIPSVKLRNMKIQEKSLNSSGEYAKAKEIHKEIKILEQEEHKKAQEDANKQYNDEVQKLVQKQAEEKAEILKRRDYKRKLILSELEQQKREIKAHGTRNIPSAQEKRKQAQNSHFSNDFEPSKSKITREAEKRSKHLLPPIRPPMVNPVDWNSNQESDYSEDGDICVPKQKKVKRIRSNSQRIAHIPSNLLPEKKKKEIFSKSLKFNNDSSSNSYNDSDLYQGKSQMDSSRDEISSSTSIESDIPQITCSKIDAASTVAWEAHWESSSDNLLSNEENLNQNSTKNQYSSSIPVKNQVTQNASDSKMQQNFSIQLHQTDPSQISIEKESEKISHKSEILVDLPNNSDSQQLGFVVHKASSIYSPRSDQNLEFQSPSKGLMRISELNSSSKDSVKQFQAIQDKISTIEMINDSDPENKTLPISDILFQSKSSIVNNNTSIDIQNEINKMLNDDQNDSPSSNMSEVVNNQQDSIQEITNLLILDKNNIISEISEEESTEDTPFGTEMILSPQKERIVLNTEENLNFEREYSSKSENSETIHSNIPFSHDQIKDPVVLRSNNQVLPIIEAKSQQSDPNIIELSKKLESFIKTLDNKEQNPEIVEIPPPSKSTTVIITKQVPIQKRLSFNSQVLADEKPSLKISDVTFYSGNFDIFKEKSEEEEEEESTRALTIGGTFAQTAPDPVEPVVIDIGGEYEEEYEEEEQIHENTNENTKAKYVIQYNQRTPYFIFAPNNDIVYVDPQTARISARSIHVTPNQSLQMEKRFGPNSTRYYD
ncbi:hypothetical protein TVAG_374050 [Trichomonas vaginalis G3]|uniref:Uncharacterized protein n=1 Tax=Trichomonas vaginalis (strain ATCC PRA-98 / G3) TaxID=412133 RepID=A2EBT6_TRIV3|nr:hypothetical protein TVAGG3_0464330 [Trichomonas vaginalis G3]EAY09898.1 hypothetical protein TVAG_374050 [Trichomonas vaginalis G3]KAI5514662.1 hypothetical protein TVAGG3_0464330 [Trichomonas vaginalis G3]|eukprot:XP_001322121.1 hypothetical protein [Trichomonas vaginalis G3]